MNINRIACKAVSTLYMVLKNLNIVMDYHLMNLPWEFFLPWFEDLMSHTFSNLGVQPTPNNRLEISKWYW